MNFIETIFMFFSFQAFLLGTLFFLKKENITTNRIFGFFLFLFAYNLFYNVLYWSKFNLRWLCFLSYTYQIPLSLYGPLFYLYVRNTVIGQKNTLSSVMHLSPLLLPIAQFGSFYVLPLQTKVDMLTGKIPIDHIWDISWGYSLVVAILGGYALYTYFKFVHHFKKDPELKIWLKCISLAFLLFALSHIAYAVLSSTGIVGRGVDYFTVFFMTIMIGLVSYFAFMHTSIFNGKAIDKIVPFVKYKRTGLSKDFSLEMKEKLLTLMDKEKPYCDPEIRLDGLANMLDISRHHASQVINEHFSMNFFDFINEYRIREAERLLLSEKEQHLSITDIAFKSGFNNRVSFYKAFKKIEGTTPSEYREHNIAS